MVSKRRTIQALQTLLVAILLALGFAFARPVRADEPVDGQPAAAQAEGVAAGTDGADDDAAEDSISDSGDAGSAPEEAALEQGGEAVAPESDDASGADSYADTAADPDEGSDSAGDVTADTASDAATDGSDAATPAEPSGAGGNPAANDPAADESEEELSEPLADASPAYTPSITYRAHVQNIGWQDWVKDGDMAGTSGKSYRVEALNIKLVGAPKGSSVEYSMHVQDIGWQDWVKDGKLGGTSGRSLRVEAMRIRLTGPIADDYDIYYRVHAQNIGWLGWVKNGVDAGTEGLSYRLEAIEIRLVEKGGEAPGDSSPVLLYRGHVQDIGWQGWVSPSNTAGTSGRSLRVEALQTRIMNADGSIRVRAHVQDIGWQGWRGSGEIAGTSGKSYRVEAIRIELTGAIADEYDIYYRVHAQNIGWMAWAKNGAPAGTEGFSYRLEAIQLKLVKKGGAAPKNGDVSYAFIGPAALEYRSAQKGGVTSAWKEDGATAGTTGKSLPTEAIAVRIPADSLFAGGVSYRVYTQDKTWSPWSNNGADAGTVGSGKRVEAFQIKLSGDIASAYDVYYRAYVQDYGWLSWARNGATAGTAGMGLRIEAYQVKLVAKGSAAPGSTAHPFLNKGVNKTGYQNPAGFYQVSANTVVLTPAAYTTAFCYVTPSRISASASRADCVNAFLKRAREYLGTPYVWDYSRQPGVGVDCIGLVYQCAYATGMDMGGGGPDDRNAFNPFAHYYSGANGWHSHDANNFWDYGKAAHVPLESRQPGDLISWPGHIAIYIGNDQIIEAYPGSGVAVSSMWAHGSPRGCIRLYQ